RRHMASTQLQVRVEKTRQGARVAVGMAWEVHGEYITVGRAADNDIQISDPSVSSNHLELTRLARGFEVVNRSQRGTTAVGGEKLAPDERKRVDEDEIWIQVGRVLLSIRQDPETIPVAEIIPVPERVAEGPIIRLRHLGNRVEVFVHDEPVSLYPMAARLLARLAQDPGHIVSFGDLGEAADPEYFERAGGANISQLVSYIRDMVEQQIDAGHLDPDELAQWVFADESNPALADVDPD